MAEEIIGMQIGHIERFIMALTSFWVPTIMAVLFLILKEHIAGQKSKLF